MRAVLGTMNVAGRFNGLMVVDREPDRSVALLTSAARRGIRIFDTAPIYARGNAEVDLGQVVRDDASVWTKVGVDIDAVLPRVDYSIDALVRALRGSRRRLGQANVSIVFVHNATSPVLATVDWPALRDAVAGACPDAAVGASLFRFEDLLAVHDGNVVPDGTPLMVERAHLDELGVSRSADLRTRHPIAVRSLFHGGHSVRSIPAGPGRRRFVADSLCRLRDEFDPHFAVVAPSTVAQLADYDVEALR